MLELIRKYELDVRKFVLNGPARPSNRSKISKRTYLVYYEANNVLEYLHENSEVHLQLLKLELNSLKLSVHNDTSGTSNDDKSSQLGYFLISRDD